jgi:cytochrome c5
MKTIVTAVVLVAGMVSWNWAAAAGDPAAGEAVFNHVCKMCHGTGMMGAPKLGDQAVWTSRVEQGESKLTEHAINGIRKMPPRGNCKTCSDDDIANAVAYMLSKLH